MRVRVALSCISFRCTWDTSRNPAHQHTSQGELLRVADATTEYSPSVFVVDDFPFKACLQVLHRRSISDIPGTRYLLVYM